MAKLAMVVAASLVVMSCHQTAPQIVFKHGETRGRLTKNGLRFVVMPDVTTELVEVDVRYEVGSREDPPGKAGLAHLVEHLMFVQRPDGPQTRALMTVMRQLTVAMNAYTNWDTTHYMATARANLLDALIKIEAIRMHDGCETIPESEFLREREVVRNEIRSRTRTPQDRIPELTLSSIYPKGHAYAQMIGGDDEQLTTITLNDACYFMRKYYVPERAVVIVAGGVKVDDAVKSIQTWFNNVDRRVPAPRRTVDPFAIEKDRKTFELDIERPWVTVAWALPDARTPDGEAAQFGVWRAFFDTATKAEEYECATQTQPTILGGREAPVFLLALELKSMDKLDQCLGFVWKAARNAGYGWDRAMWVQAQEAKHRRQQEFISSLEPLFARANRVGDLVQFTRGFDFDSRQLYVFHELDRIDKLDLERIGTATQRALDQDRARVVVFKPSKQGLNTVGRSTITFQTRSHETVEEIDVDPREARVPLRLGTELKTLAAATRFELGNGMRVVLLPTSSMPVVAAELIFDAGETSTPTNPALAWGAAEFLSQPDGSTVLGETGVRMSCDTTPDHTICRAHGMNVYLDVVIKAFERLITIGVYRQDEIERWQRSQRERYKLKRPQQHLEYERQQLASIFGPDHPYTLTGVITPQAIGKIGSDELRSFKDKHYTAGNATLVIAGAFDAKKAEALIRGTFGDWSKTARDPRPAAAPYRRTGPVYVGVIGEPDPQVDVSILYPSPAGIGGQQAARLILTAMLDERMWSVRSKLGATYGTRARREPHLTASAYEMGGAVDAPRAGEAIKAMRDSIEELRQGDDFDASFVRARRGVVQQLLAESTMSRELASRLGQIARFGLEPDYYNTVLRQAAAVSPMQVKDLLGRELDPAGEAVVVLGDRASVTKAFADAGITDVKLVEPDYR
jgi:zinc protease